MQITPHMSQILLFTSTQSFAMLAPEPSRNIVPSWHTTHHAFHFPH
jgi:hypothetical protein